MKAILERRSVRKFTQQPVADESIEALLRAAMAAPSAANDQPWHFVVINDRKTLVSLTSILPYAIALHEAPCAVMVCGDLDLKKFKQYQDFWVQDCAAATENILIAAQTMGLGSGWIGIYPVSEWVGGVRQLFNLPEHIIPLSLVPLGYSAEKNKPIDRYNPSRVRYNQW